MCDRSFTECAQWKWKSGSLVSNFILITPGLFICHVFYYRLYIWRIKSCNHIGNWNCRLWYCMVLKAAQFHIVTCLWIKSFCSFLSLIQANPNTAATILFSLPAYKYAIMVRLLSSLLGWLKWRLRLSGHSNVGLMVLTCVGHRWSPEQPWLGPFIKAGLAPEMARLAICVRGRFHSQYCWWTGAPTTITTTSTHPHPHAHIHSVL